MLGSAERRARSRFHGAFDQPVFGRVFLPILLRGASWDDCSGEFAVVFRRHSRFARGFAHDDTHDVCAFACGIKGRRSNGKMFRTSEKCSRGCWARNERSLRIVLRIRPLRLWFF